MSNPMGAGRCLACSCRRPAKLTWRPSVTLVKSSVGGDSAETGACGTAVSDDHDSECDFDEESACDEEGEGSLNYFWEQEGEGLLNCVWEEEGEGLLNCFDD